MKPTSVAMRSIVGVVLGAVAAAGAAILFLMTEPGEGLLKNAILSRVNRAIVGHAEIADLEFRLDEVELRGLVLKTRDGERVLAAERALIDISFSALLKGQLRVESLIVSDYAAYLRAKEGGWNIAAALALKEPTARAMPAFEVESFAFHKGLVELSVDKRSEPKPLLTQTRSQALGQVGAMGGTLIRLSDLAISGGVESGDLPAGQPWRGHVHIEGNAGEPLADALTVDLRGGGRQGAQEVTMSASLGEHEMSVQAEVPVADTGLELPAIQGSLRINVLPFSHQGLTYGPVQIAAKRDRHAIHVSKALAVLPGLRLERRPSPDGIPLALQLRSLHEATQALEGLLGRPMPWSGLEARGELDLQIEERDAQWGATFSGNFARIQSARVTANRVQLEGQVRGLEALPDGDFLDPDGRVHLALARVEVGDSEWRDMELDIVAERSLRVVASVGAPYSAKLMLEASRQTTTSALRIEDLQLTYPETKWTTSTSALLRLDDKGAVLEGLVLESGSQRITMDAGWTDERKTMEIAISKLRLASAPRYLLPATLRLRGTAFGHVALWRSQGVLDGYADIEIRDGFLAGLAGSLTANARFEGESIVASAELMSEAGVIRGRIALPRELSFDRDTAIAASIELEKLQLGRIWRGVRQILPAALVELTGGVSGRLQGSLAVSGTLGHLEPEGRVQLRNGAVTLRGLARYCDIAVTLKANGARLRLVRLRANSSRGKLSAHGFGEPLGAGRYRYGLQFDLKGLVFPTDERLYATTRGRIRGRVSAQRITATIVAEDVQLVRPARLQQEEGATEFCR